MYIPANAKTATRNSDKITIEWEDTTKEPSTMSQREYIAAFVRPAAEATNAQLAKDEEDRETRRKLGAEKAAERLTAAMDRIAEAKLTINIAKTLNEKRKGR